MRTWRRSVAPIALAALGVAGAACGGTGAGVRVTIPPGASVRVAAESLARARVIRAPRLFRLYASATNRDRRLKPGTYLLVSGMSWDRVLDALVDGRGLVFTVTIPEGWQLSTIVPAVAKATEVAPESLEAATRDSALLRELRIPTPTLEGYVFPATYTVAHGTTAREAVMTMVKEFERRWKPEWTDRLQVLGMSRHAVVTLASIIEKEARVDSERPIISAVYHNRLRKGMALQADPTVQYALGRHAERVLYRDLAVKSPYNTYLNPGLPPGPIASPGTASIEAALFPANVPYLYFVAHPDGHHEFRTTFREHTVAVQQMRAARRARERAARDSARRR
jgi:UPF0755 protein